MWSSQSQVLKERMDESRVSGYLKWTKPLTSLILNPLLDHEVFLLQKVEIGPPSGGDGRLVVDMTDWGGIGGIAGAGLSFICFARCSIKDVDANLLLLYARAFLGSIFPWIHTNQALLVVLGSFRSLWIGKGMRRLGENSEKVKWKVSKGFFKKKCSNGRVDSLSQ